MADRTLSNPFNAKMILLVIAAGMLAFAGFLFLTAYAPKWDRGGDGGTHVLSKSAVGFSGLRGLAELTGRPTYISGDKRDWSQNGLVIVTIGPATDRDDLKELIATRRSVADSKTLYILPKWSAMPLQGKRGFVQSFGTIDPRSLDSIIAMLGTARIEQGKPGSDRRIRGVDGEEMASVDITQPLEPRYLSGGMTPLLRDSAGRMILGRSGGEDNSYEYVLAEPDLLSNQGLKSVDGAAAAITIIDALRASDADSVAFDTVIAGIGDTRNLLQLMFEPPFLALTLALFAAAILVGLHALGRFGPPAIEGRAIPFGKRALADNIATLIARAKREDRLGDRYVAVVRDAAGAALGASELVPDALERWLGSLPGGFNDLAYAARNAPDAVSMRDAARALHEWKKDVTRDH